MQLEGQNILRLPPPIHTPLVKCNRRKYCHYHQDHRYFIEDCFELKEEIGSLVHQGRLGEYVSQQHHALQLAPPSPGPLPRPQQQPSPLRDIHTIIRGPSSVGLSNRASKAYARETIRPRTHHSPRFHISYSIQPSAIASVPLTFTDDDLVGLHLPYDEAIVVIACAGNHNVHRILVDNGISVDVLFAEDFDQLGIECNQLKPVCTSFFGFSGALVMLEGSTDLPFTVGEPPCQITLIVSFFVVHCP